MFVNNLSVEKKFPVSGHNGTLTFSTASYDVYEVADFDHTQAGNTKKVRIFHHVHSELPVDPRDFFRMVRA